MRGGVPHISVTGRDPVSDIATSQALALQWSDTQAAMSYRHHDIWSKELPNGRVIEYHYATLFQANGNKKSWAGAKMAGIVFEPIHNLPADMNRTQVEALFEGRLNSPSSGST